MGTQISVVAFELSRHSVDRDLHHASAAELVLEIHELGLVVRDHGAVNRPEVKENDLTAVVPERVLFAVEIH